MGVNGLLQVLKEIQDPCSLERYRGQTLAIDTYGWLHRALVSCAEELCLGKPTRKYVTAILNKIQMLNHFGITPYFVFDGASLPTKQETNRERQLKRQEAKELAEKYIAANNQKLAYKQYMKAAYVTSQMAKSVMCELDNLSIKYIVAPYEADPQMVYLEKMGVVDGILSEDSDLLIFGCKKLITKLKDDGTCVEINRDKFDKVKEIPYLNQYNMEQLRLVAMLSGCDYTKGVPGIGLRTAFQLVRKYNNFTKVLIALRSMGKKIPDNFIDEVKLANLAFQFQKVFDPTNQKLTTLNEYPQNNREVDDYDDETLLENCCGKTFTDEIYQKLCNGKIHPNTHEILVSREQSLTVLKSESVYSPNSQQIEKNYNQASNATIAHRSRSEGAICQAGNGKSILDLLSISKKVTITNTTTTTANGSQLESCNNDKQMKTPERKLLKRSVKFEEIKLSPTSKKLRKLVATATTTTTNDTSAATPSPNVTTSKFFTPKSHPIDKIQPANPTTKENSIKPDWDSSLIDDSEITDYDQAHHHESSDKPVDTKNILDDLTDNDNDHEEEEEETNFNKIKLDPIVDLKQSPQSDNGFDICSNDDEIEESPIKNRVGTVVGGQEQVRTRLIALKESFSYQSTTTKSTHQFLKPDKPNNERKRIPLQPKNINQIQQKSPTKSIKLNRKVDHRHQGYRNNNNVDISKAVSTVNSRSTIDIRQFAYKKQQT
ncbi:exodeoxyribonuclease, putative [Candida dubliniensis CD36]|uniref:Exodeoxyribonuclease, putative n=1 Tax=Candida dubliniensis (strain CD36 / ATCC MYA-646 / CBS 7987 / NCPF 3949 / NRRL Y-17841) TaxID=573826 RepID=B9WH04_CANDC|nr:exodeoxyribonuclease, putative [Candida dubliniensis CD36]CAX41445.1 exodeoxyribonuclease, putative [Candida dubliniensis CD36]